MWPPRRTFTRMPGVMLALTLPGTAFAVHLDYEVGLGISYDDNVNLSENNPIAEDILMPTLGFTVTELGSTVQANVVGDLEYRDYLRGHFADELRSQLAGSFNWTVLPERLDFAVQDRLGVEPVNTLIPNAPSNLQQTNVLSVGPTLSFRMGPTVRGQAELRYVDSYAEKTDEFDSQRLSGTLRAIKDLDSTSTVSANLVDDRVTFNHDGAGPDYSRYGLFGRYTRSWSSKLDLTADLGYSWLRYSGCCVDDRTNPLVRTNLLWHVTQTDSLALNLAYELSDPASGLLAGVPTAQGPAPGTGPGEQLPPGGVVTPGVTLGGATVSSAAYLARTVELDYNINGVRFDFNVGPYYRQYDYGSLTFTDLGAIDQTARGGNIGAAFRMTPLITAGVAATLENLTYDQIAREDKSRLYRVYLRQQWTRNWSWHAELIRNERHSSAEGFSSEENIAFVGITYTRG